MQNRGFRKRASALLTAVLALVLALSCAAVSFAEESSGTLTYRTDGDDDANYVDGDKTKEKSQWVKNGDVWTYTFYVDDPNAQWYVWEDSGTLMSGTYYLDSDGEVYAVTDNGNDTYSFTDKSGKERTVGLSDVYEVSYSGDYTEYNPGTTFTTETLDSFDPDEYEGVEKSEDDDGNTVYTWLDSSYSYKVTDNGDGTFTMVKTALSFTITNYSSKTPSGTPTPVYYGGLKVSKTVLSPEGEEVTDDSAQFTFTVTLTGDKITGVQTFGGIVFTNGIAKVKLRGGESVTFTEIPEGTEYSVTETDGTGYTLVSDGTVSGGIVKDETAEAAFTNQQHEVETVDIVIRKKVTGSYETSGAYTFRVSLSGLKGSSEYTMSDGNTFTTDASGNADISVELSDGESVRVSGLPVGSTYQVSEDGSEDCTISYEVTDEAGAGTVASSGGRAEEGASLSTKVETAESGEQVTVEFTNDLQRTEDLKLVKVTTDEEDDSSYTFLVTFKELKEGQSIFSSLGKLTADSDGVIAIETELKNGGTAEFYELPVGTVYQITEYASASVASFEIVDENGGTKIVQTSGANTSALKSLATADETVNEGESATVTFTNDTAEVEPDSVSVQPIVKKVVVNEDGERVESADSFTFTIEAEDEAYPMPSKTEATIQGVSAEKDEETGEYADVTAGFGSITFDEAGTYTYVVKEKAGDGRYEYDTAVYKIKYEVLKEEGLLVAYTYIYKDSILVQNAKAAEFTNVTTVVPVSLTFEKNVKGSQASYDEYFKFDLALSGLKAGAAYAADLTKAELWTQATGASPVSRFNAQDLKGIDSEGHILTYDSADGTWSYSDSEGGRVTAEPAGYVIVAGEDGTANASFYLKNGQQVSLKDIPSECSYTISEDAGAMAKEGYETSAAVTGDAVTGDGPESEAAIAMDAAARSVADTSLNADTKVSFTNSKGSRVPTGVTAALLPAGIVLAAGSSGIIFLLGKKRKKEAQ